MRTNLPVTGIEYPLQDGQSIVSKTDTKGRMPPEAFADLWQTLQAGEPWTGLVKNRQKNGDFYRVVANVVPIREQETTVGYMSVRRTRVLRK